MKKIILLFLALFLTSCGGNRCPLIPRENISFPFNRDEIVELSYTIRWRDLPERNKTGTIHNLDDLKAIYDEICERKMQIRINKNYNPQHPYVCVTKYTFTTSNNNYPSYTFISNYENTYSDYLLNGECHHDCGGGYIGGMNYPLENN